MNLYRVPTTIGFYCYVWNSPSPYATFTPRLYIWHRAWDPRRFFVCPVN